MREGAYMRKGMSNCVSNCCMSDHVRRVRASDRAHPNACIRSRASECVHPTECVRTSVSRRTCASERVHPSASERAHPIACIRALKAFVLHPRPQECTPTEFERLGGRSASKKWKQSIKVEETHPSQTIGEWMSTHELDARGRSRMPSVLPPDGPRVSCASSSSESPGEQVRADDPDSSRGDDGAGGGEATDRPRE